MGSSGKDYAGYSMAREPYAWEVRLRADAGEAGAGYRRRMLPRAARGRDAVPFADVLIAIGFGAISVSITLGIVDDPAARAVGVGLAILHVAPLAVRRRWPELVLGAMAVTGVVYVVVGFPPVGQRAAVEHDRAEGLERTREELARRAVVEERLRIARELHDVVAHALSVIAVQAGAGRVVGEDSPATAREALASIETASRSALGEMRRLLMVLRSDEGEVEPLVPSPGLSELEGLVAATVRSGLPVEVRIDGDRVALPAGGGLAAHRLVQGALTNVRKHAHASRASVVISYDPDEVRIEVLDDGVGPRANGRLGAGHGLVGMRERAALYGGTVETGPGLDGGFRVTARIPCLGETG